MKRPDFAKAKEFTNPAYIEKLLHKQITVISRDDKDKKEHLTMYKANRRLGEYTNIVLVDTKTIF